MASDQAAVPATHELTRQLRLRDLVLAQVLTVVGRHSVGIAVDDLIW